MNWFKDFAKSSFKLYSGNTIDAFQPLDFFHFYPLWYGLWVSRFMMVMDALDCDHKSFQELKHLLPGPSSMRAIIQKIIPAYADAPSSSTNYARMANFFARMLMESCPEDPFGNIYNPSHTRTEVNELIKNIPWQEASPQIAKNLGKLITAAGSLVHGLYNDVVTDFGWDAYGPYNIFIPGKNHQLLIRHFPDLSPHELWQHEFLTPIKDLKIFQFYENTEWELAFLGCHTVLKSGDPISGLKYYAVMADGIFLDQVTLLPIIYELSDKAAPIYKNIRTKDFERLKEMVMLQECYQLKKMFTAAYMNWLPTEEMKKKIKGKQLLSGILPQGKMMTSLEEYKETFHLNKFEQEVLAPNIKSA